MKNKEYEEKISGLVSNDKKSKATDKYAKRVIELPEEYLNDLNYLKIIKEKSQRELIEEAVITLIEENKTEINAIKKALGKK
jgi:metal-responsive CopG/Arc/MetJ family transcriptional regulator